MLIRQRPQTDKLKIKMWTRCFYGKFYGTYRSEALGRSRLSIAMGPGRPHYQLTASQSWTRGSRPLTVLYLPGSPPLCHGPLSFGSDNEATDHPPAPTSGFGSSLIRQPLCSLLPGFVSDSPTTCWIIRIRSSHQTLGSHYLHGWSLQDVLDS